MPCCAGWTLFDCVLPTRSGRNGQAFTWRGTAKSEGDARFAEDGGPLDPECACPACRQFSRAYLHHALKAGEIISAMLLTWHNLRFYQDLMGALRQVIASTVVSSSMRTAHWRVLEESLASSLRSP